MTDSESRLGWAVRGVLVAVGLAWIAIVVLGTFVFVLTVWLLPAWFDGGSP